MQAASSSAATLRVLEWQQHDSLPVHFSPAELVERLAVFVNLKEVDIDITFPARANQATSNHLSRPCLAPLPTLFLTSLELESTRGAKGSDDRNEDAETNFTALLLQAASKEMRRKICLTVSGASPVGAMLKVLAQPGFLLDSVQFSLHNTRADYILKKLAVILPFHPHLTYLYIWTSFAPEHENPTLPRHFLDAPPLGIKDLSIGVPALDALRAAREFARGPKGSQLKRFEIRAKIDGEWTTEKLVR